MTIKEISPKLHQFVNEVSLGYKGTIDLNLIREAADRLEELESKQENLIDYSADLNNRLDKAESYTEKLEKQLAENQPEPEPPKPKEPTFKDVFLKAFPKAVYTDVDCCTIFPKQFHPNTCNYVCEDCWNQPYFEPKEEGVK